MAKLERNINKEAKRLAKEYMQVHKKETANPSHLNEQVFLVFKFL
jgi:hypothetical protein